LEARRVFQEKLERALSPIKARQHTLVDGWRVGASSLSDVDIRRVLGQIIEVLLVLAEGVSALYLASPREE
jgi:hypothetical protein